MKQRWLRPVVAFLLVLIPLVGLYAWQVGQAALPAAVRAAGILSGQADVLSANDTAWRSASKASLAVGDVIRAVDNVRLTFGEETVIAMSPGAIIKIIQTGDSAGTLVVYQQAGRIAVETRNPLFRLESPAATLSVEQSAFRVDVNEAGDTFVLAERGLVYSRSQDELVPVAAGESLRTGAGRRPTLQQGTPVALPPPPPPPPRTATPTATPVPPTQPPQRVHVIAQGDTLTYLATKYNVTVEAIVKANNVTDPNLLSIGQRLIIPPSK